jgi:branched-chain amino acid transport system permease protein
MRALTKKNIMILVAILLTFGIVQGLISAGIINSFYEITIATICINIILAVSLNLVTGFTGQFSLGHAGFMSIGAYVCAIINMHMNSTAGFLVGTLAGALCATFIGILVGIPTLRLRGDYLAIATLGMAEIIRVVFLNMEITNGAAGLNGIPRFTNWLWLFVFTAGTIILINNFIKSSHGRACISIREDEIAAESMGINTTKYKVMAFAIGAFFAGVAGALYSSYFYFVKPDLFGFLKSIDILVIVVLGGMGSLTGSVIAAIALAVISTFLQSFTAVRMIVYAALLVVIMIFRPQGLMGTKEINDLFKFKSRKKDERIE